MNHKETLFSPLSELKNEKNHIKSLQEFLLLTSQRKLPELLEQNNTETYLDTLETFWKKIKNHSKKEILSSPKIFIQLYKQEIQKKFPSITEKHVLKYRKNIIKQFTSLNRSFQIYLELKILTLKAFHEYLLEYLHQLNENEDLTPPEQEKFLNEIFLRLMKIKTESLIETQQSLNLLYQKCLRKQREAILTSSKINEIIGKNKTKSKRQRHLELLLSLLVIKPVNEKSRTKKYGLKKVIVKNALIFISKVIQLSLIHYHIFTYNVIIPPTFYAELLKHEFTVVHGVDIRIITYREVENAEKSVEMIMPMTLIGEDDDSRKVIFDLLEKRIPLRTLIHSIPAQSVLTGNTIDDERVKEVDEANTAELRVMRSIDLIYPPIAIVDKKKIGIIPLHATTMSFNPAFLIISQDESFLNHLLSIFETEWEKAWVYEDIIEPIVQLLNTMKKQQKLNDLPENIKKWLVENNFLKKLKNNELVLTEYGRLFIANKTY